VTKTGKMKTPEDQSLIENIQAGRELDKVIKTIYRTYFKPLTSYVMDNSGNFEDARDNFQEMLISFFTIIQNRKFHYKSGLGTFLFSINRHIWLNKLRQKKQALLRENVFSQSIPEFVNDEEYKMQREQVKQQVCRLLGKLGMTCKKILVQYYYEELPVKQITQNLHMNQQVLKNKKCKCQKQLSLMIRKDIRLNKNLRELLLTSVN
jgi:RNA polymerase sigma factor (sigma-70 family)